MTWPLPTPAEVNRAIAIYLALAYDAVPPAAVRGRVESLRAAEAGTDADFFRLPVFERAPSNESTAYSLRLGNRYYPHMKLAIERSPDGAGALFRTDTHDRHIQPACGSPETAAFAELAARNQAIATRIEAAWDKSGIATFKQYLRDDLARRKAAMLDRKV